MPKGIYKHKPATEEAKANMRKAKSLCENVAKRPGVRLKISLALKGKKFSKERIENLKKAWKSRPPMTEETKHKIGIGRKIYFQKHPEERERKSRKIRGENNPNWWGGLKKNPYPAEFNKLLKEKIRKKYDYTCCLCGRTEREELEELNQVLCVNHIDFDKNNCKEENLNTLCVRCNVKINREREYWTNYFKYGVWE